MFQYYLFCCLLLIPSVSANCLQDTILRDSPAPGGVTYGYTGLLGPLNWANLDRENYSVCATGSYQSPVNLNDTTVPVDKENFPQLSYPPFNGANMSNTGHTIKVQPPSGVAVYARYKQQVYILTEFHFHLPSEHRVYEEFFVAEMHLVHTKATDNSSLLVLTVLFDLVIDSGLEFIDIMTAKLGDIEDPGNSTYLPWIDLGVLRDSFENSTMGLFTYMGSLTTPPCTEGVTHIIPVVKRYPMTVGQFNAFKGIIKFNSRYTQNTLGKGNLLQLPQPKPQRMAYSGKLVTED